MAKTYIRIDDAKIAETYTAQTEISIESLLKERDAMYTRLKQLDELILVARALIVQAAVDTPTTQEQIDKDGKLDPRPVVIAGDGPGTGVDD
jgi:hypothetical protein